MLLFLLLFIFLVLLLGRLLNTLKEVGLIPCQSTFKKLIIRLLHLVCDKDVI